MSSFIPQSQPNVLAGTLAQRPVATKLKIGTFYVATDTYVLYMVSVSAGVKSWIVPGGVVTTTPGAYPYTTLDSDQQVAVDSAGGARTIKLHDGTTNANVVIEDAGDNSAVLNITVQLENAAKKLNGTVNGTLLIATNGALRGFTRDVNGNWRGGV